MSSPLSSWMFSSSLDKPDMYSSSVSMLWLPVVTGVGGPAEAMMAEEMEALAAEAATFLLGRSSALAGMIVASAAFRFRVVGVIVAAETRVCGRGEAIELVPGRRRQNETSSEAGRDRSSLCRREMGANTE